jgi:hypothetical protein
MNFKPNIAKAEQLATVSLQRLMAVPQGVNPKDPGVTEIRRSAYTSNMAAQDVIAQQFGNTSQGNAIMSLIRQADSQLEEANWATTGKTKPNGAGGHVDIPNAIQDTQNAIGLLHDARTNASGWWIFS